MAHFYKVRNIIDIGNDNIPVYSNVRVAELRGNTVTLYRVERIFLLQKRLVSVKSAILKLKPKHTASDQGDYFMCNRGFDGEVLVVYIEKGFETQEENVFKAFSL